MPAHASRSDGQKSRQSSTLAAYGRRWVEQPASDEEMGCWAQKKTGSPNQREHWKRYDYALASRALVDGGADGVRLVDVRHLHDAFEGGRPDHLPVEAVLAVSARRDDNVTKRRTG